MYKVYMVIDVSEKYPFNVLGYYNSREAAEEYINKLLNGKYAYLWNSHDLQIRYEEW